MEQAPDTRSAEIEVTDEMIEAGERALLAIGCTDDPGVCALVAFEAMWRARHTLQKEQKENPGI
jgi:hypothetical protein